MARYVDAIDLPIPIEEAFAYLADFSHTAEWDPSVVAAENVTEGPVGPGSRFQVTVRFAATNLSLVYEIVEFEPPNRLVLEGGNESFRSIDEISFVPRGDGTRVTYEARIELTGLRRLADPLLGLAFQRIGQLAARGLRGRIDERVRGGESAARGRPRREVA
jgi:hypothetical protein